MDRLGYVTGDCLSEKLLFHSKPAVQGAKEESHSAWPCWIRPEETRRRVESNLPVTAKAR